MFICILQQKLEYLQALQTRDNTHFGRGLLCISRLSTFLNKEDKVHKLPLSRRTKQMLVKLFHLECWWDQSEFCYQVHGEGKLTHLHRGGKLKLYQNPSFLYFPDSEHLNLQYVFSLTVFYVSLPVSFLKRKLKNLLKYLCKFYASIESHLLCVDACQLSYHHNWWQVILYH